MPGTPRRTVTLSGPVDCARCGRRIGNIAAYIEADDAYTHDGPCTEYYVHERTVLGGVTTTAEFVDIRYKPDADREPEPAGAVG